MNMNCTKCGHEVARKDRYCAYCGLLNEYYYDPEESTNSNEQRQQNAFYTDRSSYAVQTESSAGLICGIIGIFFAGIILGIIALVLSSKPNCAKPTAVKVLGVVDIIGAILVLMWLYSLQGML